MATNKQAWVRDLLGSPQPLVMFGLFQAGATQAIKRGEILERTAGGATQWVPIDSDFVMDSDIAVANEEIKSGDLAGYYEIIVPRPGDVFSFALAAAGASIVSTALYYSDSQTVTITAGTTIIGRIAGNWHYPRQGHASDSAVPDQGTTLRTVSTCEMVFREAVSYYSLFQVG